MPNRLDGPGRPRTSIQIEAREQKICTVAFIDIVRSTELIEHLAPEDALDRLAPAVSIIMGTCEDFGASVRFVGDGALAVFGFPRADEDHALRAVEAGLSVLEQMSQLKAQSVDIRIGLHCGPVLFSNFSHVGFDELTLTGSVVHLADKIQSSANKNAVTVSRSVIQSVEGMFEYHLLAGRSIPQQGEPFELFEISGRKPGSSRWRTRIGRGLSPFVGRADDRDTLLSAWRAAAAGRGSALAVVGEAGIGKSRLVHEFAGSIPEESACIIEFDATALDHQVAYAPVSRALSHWFDLPAGGSATAIAEALKPYVFGDGEQAALRTNALLGLLTARSADPAWNSLTATMQSSAILEALVSLFGTISEERPLILVFEDMHWADDRTRSLAGDLALAASGRQMLVLMTSRTADTLPSADASGLEQLHLGPLDDGSSRNLIRWLLPKDQDSPELENFIAEICGQTPLFIEEIARNIKHLGPPNTGHGGRSFKVPDSVQPLIAQRIDALTAAQRQALQIASVLGSEFSVETLRTILRREGLADDEPLQSLAAHGLLEKVDRPTGRFHHALIQQVAYSSLPKKRRRHLHSLAVDVVSGPASGKDLAATRVLAFHAEHSERWLEAADAFIRCGHLALDRAAFEDAIDHFRHSIACAEQIPSDPQKVATLGIQARQGLRIAILPKADFLQILEITGEVEKLAVSVGDDASALRANIDRVIMMTILSDVNMAVEIGEEALALTIRSGADGLTATAAFALSQAYWFRGDYEKSARTAAEQRALFTPETDRLTVGTAGTVSVLGVSTEANALTMLGRYEDARVALERAKALALHTGKAYDAAFTAIAEGFLLLGTGQFVRSRAVLSEAKEICDRARIEVLPAFLSAPLARACAGAGDLSAALAAIELGHGIAAPKKMQAFVAQLLAAELDITGETASWPRRGETARQLAGLCERNGYHGLLPRRSDRTFEPKMN